MIFSFGVTWMALFMRPAALGFTAALNAGFYPFLLGDVFKICFGAAALPGLWKLIGDPRSLPRSRRAASPRLLYAPRPL